MFTGRDKELKTLDKYFNRDKNRIQAIYARALAIDEKTYGKNHPQVATYANNLGLILKELGQLPEAQALLELALAIRLEFFGADYPHTKQVKRNLQYLRSTSPPTDNPPALPSPQPP